MVFTNVIVDITICSRAFVFSQSDVQIFASLINISGLAVAAFHHIISSLSVARLIFGVHQNQNVKYRFMINADVVGMSEEACDSFRHPFDIRYGCRSDWCRVSVRTVRVRVLRLPDLLYWRDRQKI